mmetsp:Transcript_29363/g.61439  ORF Transcript_29363/g.61439 Transcript_29363/m.61439 type:complete len:93 (-) Transcript_29363:221-499(-)|eukprot:CAMPEP_0172438924 /NCGR_PEP_ID=MMETSP1065-20121228/45_1 /TAXON_ID=265537 /ORGANISM="Amphiprora paludosa, Strain CCMP125" /LENGTH=92 /DNA_ID=CAMNT_0013187521 /DNA_START=63 /DNA_END=341 /DNA_ORIENTATION=-
MARVLFFLALLVASASAFVAPANNGVAFARPSAMKMVPVEVVDVDAVSTFAQNANLIASNSDDFGGYFYPVAGLGLLSALILYLSPPLVDDV